MNTISRLLNWTIRKTQASLPTIIVGIALFTACSEVQKGDDFKDYFSNTEVVALNGESVALEEGEKPLSYMFNMTFFDSLILVNEFPDREYTYKLIDLRDRSVRPFGKKGEGPNQLLSDAFYFSVDQKDKRLYLTDQVHYYIYNIGDLKKGLDEPTEKFTINQQENRFMGSTVHVYGYIVGSMHHKRFCAYDIEEGYLIEEEEYPGGPAMAMANQSFFMNHPTKNLAVYGMSRMPEFGILTVLPDTIEVNKYAWGDTPMDVQHGPTGMHVVDEKESTYEYTSVAATEDLIYFLYSGKKIIHQIPESGTLESKEVGLANAALMPYKIVVSADKAVILDQGKENLFKVYDLPDFSFLYTFGNIGEGPDEFQFVNGNSLKIHGEHLVVLSGTQLIKIKLQAEKATWEEQFKLISDTGGPINGLHLVNDSVYVADIGDAKPGAPEHRLVHLGRNEELVRFGEYPEPAAWENRDQANLSRDYGKRTVANPEDGRLAAFYLFQNQVRLYGADGELLQEIEVKSSSNSASDEEMWIYRADPFASSERIYVLYIGMPKKEVEENSQTFRPHLEVWDWEGNLLDRFRLDQPITTFTYAEEFKKLYGISFFKEDVLYEYDLK